MINNVNLSESLNNKLAIDANGLSRLKTAAHDNSPEAIKAVAKQFEGIFMNMLLKSMRDATPQDGEFDSEQTRSFTSMLDQQLAQNLSSKGLGLSEVLAKQLTARANIENGAVLEGTKTESSGFKAPANPIKLQDKTSNPLTQSSVSNNQITTIAETLLANESLVNNPVESFQQSVIGAKNAESIAEPKKINSSNSNSLISQFQQKMQNHVDTVSRNTGIPSQLMLGQAALESGWGSREIKANNGSNSHNLFGIKASGDWKGKVVEATTTEFIDGVKQKRIEKFRAYDSYTESFQDFANLMKANPRYNKVMENTNNPEAYAKALQQAGYATDPNYAAKLSAVIKRVTSG